MCLCNLVIERIAKTGSESQCLLKERKEKKKKKRKHKCAERGERRERCEQQAEK